MKTNIPFTRFELDGVLFLDQKTAIGVAQTAVREEAEGECRKAGPEWKLTDFEVRLFDSIVPAGAVVIEGLGSITDALGKIVFLRGFSRSVRRVDLSSPVYGKYVANVWTRDEVFRWCRRDELASADHYEGFSPEEKFYFGVAYVIGGHLAGDASLPELLLKIGSNWNAATSELERNQAAEALVCAQDLDLIGLHDLLSLPDGIAARADELRRIRELAGLMGAP